MKSSETSPEVFLHSDDAGGSQAVTEGITKAWRAGWLDGFSVFANGVGLDGLRQALDLAPERPPRMMVHLNLSEGPSSAPAADVPLLVDGNGELKLRFGGLVRKLLVPGSRRREFLRQVETEWRAQIAGAARALSPHAFRGVDGHLHLHMLPLLFPIAARLARESGLQEIRLVREPFFTASAKPGFMNMVKHAVLRLCSVLASPALREYGLRSRTRVVGVLYSGGMTSDAAWSGMQAAGAEGARDVEIMFHIGRARSGEEARWPGRADIAEFNLSAARDGEMAELACFHARLVSQGLRAGVDPASGGVQTFAPTTG